MPDYRKLDVYKLACSFADRVVSATRALPKRLNYKRDQLCRAADSIHEAIAEGCGLGSDAQLLKYLRIALGSANECEAELHTLMRRGLLAESDFDLLTVVRQLCAMLAKFIMRVESDLAREKRSRKARDGRSPNAGQQSQSPPADAEGRGPQPSG